MPASYLQIQAVAQDHLADQMGGRAGHAYAHAEIHFPLRGEIQVNRREKLLRFSGICVPSCVGMRFVVNIHQLANGRMRVLLCGRKRLVPQQFLNCAQIRAIRKEVRGERVPQ